MNQIVVKQDARDLGIENPVGCLISGLDVRTDAPELDEDVSRIERTIKERPDEILDKDEVRAFRELYSRMGYPEQTPDGEQRVRLIGKRGINRHNNVVDAYNIAGAEYGVGLGMHDATYVDGDVIFQRASGDERIIPLFRESYVTAQPGDLVYGTDRRVLWISGRIGRDSDEFKVTDTTKEALLVAEGNHKTSEEYNKEICRRAYDLITKTCPNATMDFLDVVYEKKAVVA